MTPENQQAFDTLVRLFALQEPQISLFRRYIEAVEQTNQQINLVSRKDIHRLVARHVFESVAIARLAEIPDQGVLLDLGSGAGFPGIIIAILKPALKVVLLDSIQKKSRFLKDTTISLGLKNTLVVCDRAESPQFKQEFRQRFDVVVARSVAALPKLWKWSEPLLKKKGLLLAQKGGSIDEEMRELLREASVITQILPLPTMTDDPKYIVCVRRSENNYRKVS
ncbi:MAG: 16S rRNA (guanine(527)-N(7))-methyltransferase RsmG [candidate division KSB1 bacterium]|nr:16S rRNA (guanine(527)-N(7))-methyltransferase RsmG [candidate division KSB1 bacterium]